MKLISVTNHLPIWGSGRFVFLFGQNIVESLSEGVLLFYSIKHILGKGLKFDMRNERIFLKKKYSIHFCHICDI